MKDNKQKYITKIRPPSSIEIDSPCEIIFKEINQDGQAVFLFLLPRGATVENFKVSKDYVSKKEFK